MGRGHSRTLAGPVGLRTPRTMKNVHPGFSGRPSRLRQMCLAASGLVETRIACGASSVVGLSEPLGTSCVGEGKMEESPGVLCFRIKGFVKGTNFGLLQV